jgi:hypothetical protein
MMNSKWCARKYAWPKFEILAPEVDESVKNISQIVFHPNLYQALTYLLTLWGRGLLGKLTGSQLVKKFPAFYGTHILLPLS